MRKPERRHSPTNPIGHQPLSPCQITSNVSAQDGYIRSTVEACATIDGCGTQHLAL
jgi:hypothetical protein